MPEKFKQRSVALELMDNPDIPRDLLFSNLRELDTINGISGGYSATLRGLKKLMIHRDKIYHIADLGCGGGGMLIRMAEWAGKNGFKVKLTGVDRNSDAVDYLNDNCRNYPQIKGVICDYRDYLKTSAELDIIHCSLFCHHLRNEELSLLLKTFKDRAGTGFIINDLQRTWLAYYVIWLITRIMNTSVLSKNDGPLSVLRGFTKAELHELLISAGIRNFTISKWPAFRYLIVGNTH